MYVINQRCQFLTEMSLQDACHHQVNLSAQNVWIALHRIL